MVLVLLMMMVWVSMCFGCIIVYDLVMVIIGVLGCCFSDWIICVVWLMVSVFIIKCVLFVGDHK